MNGLMSHVSDEWVDEPCDEILHIWGGEVVEIWSHVLKGHKREY